MTLESLYSALSRAPTGLRGLFYLVVTCAGIALAPLVMFVAAVQWLGTRNRLPTIGETTAGAMIGVGLTLVWLAVLTFLLADGFAFGVTDCPADIVTAAVAAACEGQ